jgi:hypothetical protein
MSGLSAYFSTQVSMPLFKSKTSTPQINLLELRPKRNHDYEQPESGRINILVPRFGTGKIVKALAPRMAKSTFRVRLDGFGSFVWQHCDGETTVAEICRKMRDKFGETVEPVDDRVGRFVEMLIRHDYVLV